MTNPTRRAAWLPLLAVLLLTSACSQTPAAQTPPGDAASPGGFEVTELTPDLIVLTSQPWAANSLLVRTADGTIVLVDTPATGPDTEALLDWTRQHWGAAPAFALNSHWHFDAAGGNAALIAAGVEVISSTHTAQKLRDRGESMRAELIETFSASDPDTAAELERTAVAPANRTVEVTDQLTLELGGDEVVLVFPGHAHSDDSLGVYFPRHGVLYGGCTVRSDGTYGYLGEADVEHMPHALEVFAGLEPRFVIPGHGARFEAVILDESLDAARQLEPLAP